MLAASQRSQDDFLSPHLTHHWRQLKQPVRLLLFLGIVVNRLKPQIELIHVSQQNVAKYPAYPLRLKQSREISSGHVFGGCVS